MCVQGFDDSRNSAIHITYRISLRPSSLRLPRHPWFAIVLGFDISRSCSRAGLLGRRKLTCNRYQVALWFYKGFVKFKYEGGKFHVTNDSQGLSAPPLHCCSGETLVLKRCGNDPSAGSPTETLLRLHLPLNDKVKITSRGRRPREEAFDHDPRVSPDHSIGRCDGRCVQRAGT